MVQLFIPRVTEDIVNLFVVDTVNKRIFHIDPSKANHDGIVTDHLSMMVSSPDNSEQWW